MKNVQRRRQSARTEDRMTAAGFDEGHVIEPADFIFDSNGAIEHQEVGTTAEEHVLAVVYNFAGCGMLVGRRASAEKRTALEDGQMKSAWRKRRGGSGAGQSASDDSHRGLRRRHQRIRFKNPLPRMVSFSRVLRLIRCAHTS